MAQRLTVKLQAPIKVGEQGEPITELAFREAKAKDFRNMPLEPKMGDMLDLAGKLCGQPAVVMDLLSVSDMAEVMETVGKFMPGGQPTGAIVSH